MRIIQFSTFALMLLLSGCATTIGNKADVNDVTFEVGKTHKDTVADTLGLPANISHSKALNREFWAYQTSPELTGVMYALPTGGGTATTFNAYTGEDGSYELEDADIVYVFDEAGILIDMRKFEQNQER